LGSEVVAASAAYEFGVPLAGAKPKACPTFLAPMLGTLRFRASPDIAQPTSWRKLYSEPH